MYCDANTQHLAHPTQKASFLGNWQHVHKGTCIWTHCFISDSPPGNWGGAGLTPWQKQEAQQMETSRCPGWGTASARPPHGVAHLTQPKAACLDLNKHHPCIQQEKQREEKALGWSRAGQTLLRAAHKTAPDPSLRTGSDPTHPRASAACFYGSSYNCTYLKTHLCCQGI